jgi:hypothetical protein
MSTPAGDALPGQAAAAAAAVPRCDNCGASVTGRYCGNCGQRLEPPVHSLWHFIRVATEDVTHADSRLWRTLWALLFRPGLLTREFLAGRRARYLPPVRLYLVLSVVFFLWIAATQRSSIVVLDPGNGHASELREMNQDLDEAASEAPPKAAAALAGARRAVVTVVPAASAPPGGVAAAPAPAAPGTAATPSGAKAAAAGSTSADTTEGCDFKYDGPWKNTMDRALHKACENALRDNGRALRQAFLHNLPHAMFLFLPLLAGAMMLFYWRPRRYYVEHLLFFVHNHAFAFLFFMLLWALSWPLRFARAPLQFAATLYLVWYMYRSMRVVYGQGRGRTTAKLVALSFLYLVCGVLMLVLTTFYSVLTL